MTTSSRESEVADGPRISSGNAGLDHILCGGLDPNRMYLYEGRPGTGKTTLAMQFLLEGARQNQPVLYVALSESEAELRLVARRHGWSLNGIDIFELVPPETTLDPERELTVLHPAEIELSETIKLIFDKIEQLSPARVVVDSLSELRLLAQNPVRYRRQVLALKHFFMKRNCTVVLLDDLTSRDADLQLHSICHGVVLLEQLAINYGAQRRRLSIVKCAASSFGGDITIYLSEEAAWRFIPALLLQNITLHSRETSRPVAITNSIIFWVADWSEGQMPCSSVRQE